MTERQTVGQFISILRKSNGFTQQALGEKIGVSGKTVSKWERDVGLPDVMTLPALAETLGVTIEELLSGKRFAVSGQNGPESGKKSAAALTNLFQQREMKFRILSIVALGVLLLALLFEVIFLYAAAQIVLLVLFFLFLLGGGFLQLINTIVLRNSTDPEQEIGGGERLEHLKRKRNMKIFNYTYAVGAVLICIAAIGIVFAVRL